MHKVGFRNKLPRKGTRQDVAMRKHALKTNRNRLPRSRDLEKLKVESERALARSSAMLGVRADEPKIGGDEA